MVRTDVRRIGVVGAGVMGPGIALHLAIQGYDVDVVDIDPDALVRAEEDVGNSLDNLVDGGLVDPGRVEAVRSRIEYTTDTADLADADYVTEAVTEALDVKRDVFSDLERICDPDVVLASNTSGIDINDIASATDRPEQVIATHWMTPPEVIPTVEVIVGDETSEATESLVLDLLEDAGKETVLLRKAVPGYLVNRMNFALAREALSLMERDVVRKEDVDTLFRHAFGPRYTVTGLLGMLDLFGHDTNLSISEYLNPTLADDDEPSHLLKELVEDGKLGVKSGEGFYEYEGTPEEVKADVNDRLMERFKALRDE